MLFLHSDDLDPALEPESNVTSRALYGVIPTGNQADPAIEFLVQNTIDDYSAAVDCLTRHQYMDVVISGAGDADLREEQINQSIAVLALGGFKFKYMIRSGE